MKSLAGLSRLLDAVLWLLVIVDVADFTADLARFSLLMDLQAGSTVDVAHAATLEFRQVTTATARVGLFFLGVVVFLVWFARAHRNLGAAGLEELKFSPRWVVASVLIPIVNFLLPYIVRKEVWAGSAALAQVPRSNWKTMLPSQEVKTWWIVCVIAMLLARGANRLFLNAGFEPTIGATVASLLESAMSFATITDLVTSLAAATAAVAAAIGAVVAVRGLNTWRSELRTKRDVEVAGDALSLAYEIEHIIRAIRSPVSFSSESDIPRNEGESDREYKARAMASVPLERYNRHFEIFSRYRILRYRFAARFGKDATKPLDDLSGVVLDIFAAARRLARAWADTRPPTDRRTMRQESDEAIIWEDYADDDPIRPRVDRALSEIEEKCRPIVSL